MTEWHLDPRLADDTHPLAQMALCDWRLMDDSHYPWLVLVPRVAGATELVDLSESQQQELLREVSRASHLLRASFAPDKLNVAALGNVVPQLHVHVVARNTGDIAWPGPVWGHAPASRYGPEALVERISMLLQGLADA